MAGMTARVLPHWEEMRDAKPTHASVCGNLVYEEVMLGNVIPECPKYVVRVGKCGRWHERYWYCELVRYSISAAGERRLKILEAATVARSSRFERLTS
jgi:hypothetical protein